MATMQFGGEEIFQAAPERVYALLTDLDGLPAGIPDLVSSERVDAGTLQCTVRPGFSFLRGTMKLRIALADLVPPQAATMRIDASGIGVSMKVVSRMQLQPVDGDVSRTKLTWQAEVSELKGLVATLSPALVRAAADQVLRHGWQQMHARLAPKSES
jgi:carbon monoxide dehydrogenase subunit G